MSTREIPVLSRKILSITGISITGNGGPERGARAELIERTNPGNSCTCCLL
jgi:hypothetical protein